MTFDYPLSFNVVKFIGVMGRISGFVMAVPIFSTKMFGQRGKVVFIMMLSIFMMPFVPNNWTFALGTTKIGIINLFLVGVSELILGALIAFMVLLMIETFVFAGTTIGVHMGFGFARAIDPSLEVSSSIIGILLSQFFVLIFLVSGGHYGIIKLAFNSFSIPQGTYVLNNYSGTMIMQMSKELFYIALKLSLPLFATLLFINIGLALMTKFAEDFQVLMLAFPIRIGLGFLILITLFPAFIPVEKIMIQNLFSRFTSFMSSF